MATVETGLVPLAALRFTGTDLRRPECVLCASSGDVYAADWRGGVTRIAPDGAQQTVVGVHPDGGPLQPNGIALASDGTFLVAHLGANAGGVFRLGPQGTVTPLLTEIDGKPLPPTNYVIEDAAGRLWITVSTWLSPRALGYRADVADGFVVLRRPSRRAHRRRRPGLHQRARDRPVGTLAVGQRDVRTTPLALRDPRRRHARSPADGRRRSARASSPTVSRSTPKGTRG